MNWVGTDFYSRYPNWRGLSSFYAAYSHVAPFTFGEYAIWDGDNPSWARTLFSWVSRHPDTQMLMYNDASPDFWLSQFPASEAVIRSRLAAPKFLAYAPEWAPAGGRPTLTFRPDPGTSPLTAGMEDWSPTAAFAPSMPVRSGLRLLEPDGF